MYSHCCRALTRVYPVLWFYFHGFRYGFFCVRVRDHVRCVSAGTAFCLSGFLRPSGWRRASVPQCMRCACTVCAVGALSVPHLGADAMVRSLCVRLGVNVLYMIELITGERTKIEHCLLVGQETTEQEVCSKGSSEIEGEPCVRVRNLVQFFEKYVAVWVLHVHESTGFIAFRLTAARSRRQSAPRTPWLD